MDSGLTIRPSDGVAQTAIVRPSTASVPQAVATDLAASKAVNAAERATATRNDSRPIVSEEPATRIDIRFDKKTKTTVYRIIDSQTGRVLVQVPQRAQTDLTV
jgi:uncharacterized FlaG/YvyC family protein